MSDEVEDLVGWLLDWPYQGETMAEEAAVLIKQLTAERDRLRVSNMQMLGDIAVALGRIEALTAERDRLRAALEDIADHDTGATAGLAYTAKIALKGETL